MAHHFSPSPLVVAATPRDTRSSHYPRDALLCKFPSSQEVGNAPRSSPSFSSLTPPPHPCLRPSHPAPPPLPEWICRHSAGPLQKNGGKSVASKPGSEAWDTRGASPGPPPDSGKSGWCNSSCRCGEGPAHGHEPAAATAVSALLQSGALLFLAQQLPVPATAAPRKEPGVSALPGHSRSLGLPALLPSLGLPGAPLGPGGARCAAAHWE